MIHELEPGAYRGARPLFRSLETFQPMCTAVLEGVYPGRVFADDPSHPQTALLCTYLAGGGPAWCFLAGDALDEATNRALNEAISAGKVARQDTGAFLFTCDPEDWGGQLPVVFRPRPPVPMRRRHYLCREMDYDWRARLPEGFSVEAMDAALLIRPGLMIPNDVHQTLTRWQAIASPRLRDYGFVVIHGDEVVAWATVDFVAGGRGDIGFFTLEPYRRRGLATAVAAAALEHGLARDLSAVSWTCGESNLGSIRTAETLGCERERDYTIYILTLDEAESVAQEAYGHLQAGRYEEAIAAYERLLALVDEPPAWAYFEAAQAWAAVGDREKALAHLNTAVERGWSSAAALEGCPEFQILHDTPQWAALLAHIRAG
jgi:RimJ/RimL family protein N-acetyltransferase